MKRWMSSGMRTAAPFLTAVAMLFGNMQADAAELLMFESRGCAWCAAWHREVGPGYAKSSEGTRAPLRREDLADAAKIQVALASPVVASPTFILVDRGREIGRITGYPGADFFWGLVGQLIAKLDPVGAATPKS